MRVAHDLERERQERVGRRRPAQHRLAVGLARGLDRRQVERRRQVVHDGVEQGLHALVAQGRSTQHDHGGVLQGGPAHGRAQVRGRHIGPFVAQETLHDLVVDLGHGLDQGGARSSSALGQLAVRHGLGIDLGAQLASEPQRPHLEQIDHALELALDPDGDLRHQRPRRQVLAQHVHGALEGGANPVHLVDEGHTRHAVAVGLTPHGLGLGLDPGDRVEHRDRPVEYTQATLDLDRKVHVTGRVDDVDPVLTPATGGGGRRDRDTALLLLLHVVHDRRAVVDLADPVRDPRVVEDALGRRGLPGVDVRHDPDVSDPGDLSVVEHGVEGERAGRLVPDVGANGPRARPGHHPSPSGGGVAASGPARGAPASRAPPGVGGARCRRCKAGNARLWRGLDVAWAGPHQR